MAQLSDVELAQLLRNAGVSADQVPTMVAIALAESGGNSTSQGDVGLETATWGPSVGPWQIRSYNSQLGTGGTRDASANLADPQVSANHAAQILRTQGLSAWSTYTSGAYRMFLGRGQSASMGVNTATSQPNKTDVPGVSDLVKIFRALSDPHTYTRVCYVMIGALLVGLGFFLLVQGSAFKSAKAVVNKVTGSSKGKAKAVTPKPEVSEYVPQHAGGGE